jgi:hypothetical protein
LLLLNILLLIYVSEQPTKGGILFSNNNQLNTLWDFMLTVYVTKFDGTQQPFDKNKIVKTCLRMGATPEVAQIIADRVEQKIYNGVSTKKILQMTFRLLRKYKPAVKNQIDLRRALSMLRSAPDFEQFVQHLLREHGYAVTSNQIVRGRCVEHEVDAIATKSGKTCIVEVKHHYHYHTRTNLDVSRISRAVFEDVTEGYELGLNHLKIDYAMIVCNTKLTEHARRYADCRGISHIGWSSPKRNDLQTMIEEKKAYPITFLKGLNAASRQKLTSNGIVMLKQLTENSPRELKRKTGISTEKLELLLGGARAILSET